MTKDTYIRIRLTAEEKQEIREAAESNRKNMSDYILSLHNKEKIRKEINKRYGTESCNVLNDLTVEEFLETYSESIQDRMSELGYYVEDGFICID